MKHSELVERVAKSICDGNWNAVDFNSTPNGEEPEELRDYWRDIATGAIAEVLKAVQEPSEQMCAIGRNYTIGTASLARPDISVVWQTMLAASPLAPEVET